MFKRKWCIFVAVCLLMIFVMLMPAFQVKASEEKTSETKTVEAVSGTLQQVVKAVEIKEKPDKNSDTLASLEKGTAVIVYGEPQDAWSQIEYRGIEGYIESAVLEQYQAENIENLEQEFQTVEEETLRTIDEYELQQKEKHTSRIWGAVISLLVIVIFAIGVISALKQSKEEKEEE